MSSPFASAADAVKFLKAVHGEAFVGFQTIFALPSKKTTFYSAAQSKDLAADIIRWRDDFDLYGVIGTQRHRLGGSARGSANTVHQMSGLVIDVDFASKKDTTKRYVADDIAAAKIRSTLSMAPSAVVATGNGEHWHWFLDQPIVIETDDDLQLAKSLTRDFSRYMQAVFRGHGAEIDSIGDIARAFRLPGTFNLKGGGKRPIELQEIDPDRRYTRDTIASLFASSIPLPTAERRVRPSTGFAPARHDAIRSGCTWYADVTGDGASGCSEPDWFAAASITACCQDGEAIFHAYSGAYPGYDHREAQKKFDGALSQNAPRTCFSIETDLGHKGCLACPSHGKITSPVQLGSGPRRYDPGDEGPVPLGYDRDGHFALRDPVRNIIIVASAQQLLSSQWLQGVAPSTFWRRQFPTEKAFSAAAAGEAIIAACKHAGPFSPTSVRGRGVWLEDGEVVLNLGGSLRSGLRHQYLCFEPIPLPADAAFDTERLSDLLNRFRFRDQKNARLLLGWLAIAPICGVLAWRPHCFVYGPPKAGKSTLHSLATALLTPLAISTTGDSSEAGIRQAVGPDSLPVIIDEFESDQRRGSHQAIVRLARSASSGSTPILRGTPEGKVMQFSLRTAFFFSGINPAGLSPADASRILLLELLMHESDQETGRAIAAEMAHFAKAGPNWCAYMASKALQIEPAKEAYELAMPGMDARLRTNIATLLAGSFVALRGRVPLPAEVEADVAEFASTTAEHAVEVDRDDAVEALHHLFAYMVAGSSLGQWLAREHRDRKNDSEDEKRLSARIIAGLDIVMKVGNEEPGFFLLKGAPGVEKIFVNTKWAGEAWVHAIRKLDGAFSPTHPVYFANIKKKARAIGIGFEILPEPTEEPDDDDPNRDIAPRWY
ncbi:hypothetical protein [Methylobacterium oxalidis]|uniref:DUF927 domain-containing protein n=1 Tax=Methylobacterium oxalidis TaxID=944322 RepID=A0A512JBB2_9HYPH|nr:hypothetical protein [Methylobacterium oxalidis]GEP07165.1 hypothetical protein MOX02_52030 [Methylobacterium oxalidis]GJE31109.1 hypothetical protein LDDCCGHA_1282 [Methylobacterium oxalidis]GLS64422.1 hypothetical protein GCM10007888_28030 [Methylobacterium oxalidis]